MNKWIAVIIVLASYLNSFAQETVFYKDHYSSYVEGKTFYEEGLYLQSKESLEAFLAQEVISTPTSNEIQQAELMIVTVWTLVWCYGTVQYQEGQYSATCTSDYSTVHPVCPAGAAPRK